jgi:prepilin-type N-terminal cleavage/methylation domain-containing protein/prepilin-type processing-associated H-X9-DG protein
MTIEHRHRKRSSGFTLIEVLVVLVIVALACSIYWPFLSMCREANRRHACQSSLVQLVIAINNYEQAFNVYPAGTIEAKGPILSLPRGYHHNWISRILPYIEAGNAYRAIDWKAGVYAPANGAVRAKPIELLLCRSLPAGNLASSYAAVHNDVETPIDVGNRGVSFLNSRVRRDDILDGLSQTVFIGEKQPDIYDLGWMSGTRATLRNMGSPLCDNAIEKNRGHHDEIMDYSNTQPTDESYIDNAEFISQVGVVRPGDKDDPERNAGRGTATGSGNPVAKLSSARTRRLSEVGGFSGNHQGGVQFAFGDGSVRFLSNKIATAVRLQLAHRSDGKLLAQEP